MDPLQSLEPAVQALVTEELLKAIHRIAIRALDGTEGLGVAPYRRVERLMRLALTLSGAGHLRPPHVQVHNIRSEPGSLPEMLSVKLTDLLAARASDHLADALLGKAEAREALEREAERMILVEDVQLG